MNNSTASYHKAILNFLLDYKKIKQSKLTFYLRKSDKKQRQKAMYFFHGNDDYISVPFYKPSGGFNNTQTIGFNFWMKSTDEPILEIVHNDSVDLRHLSFYTELINELKKIKGWRKVNSQKNKTQFFYPKQMWKRNLTIFLEQHKPLIDRWIRIHQLGGDFFVKEEELKIELENFGAS